MIRTLLVLGAVVYSAAIVLAEYLNSNPHVVHEKNVLELGCGTGLVSIVSSLLGRRRSVGVIIY